MKAVITRDLRLEGGPLIRNADFSASRTTGASRRAHAARIGRRRKARWSAPSATCAAISSTAAPFLHDADLDHQRQLWRDGVANVRLRGTTRERPRVRFDREERFLLQPLAPRRYTSDHEPFVARLEWRRDSESQCHRIVSRTASGYAKMPP